MSESVANKDHILGSKEIAHFNIFIFNLDIIYINICLLIYSQKSKMQF